MFLQPGVLTLLGNLATLSRSLSWNCRREEGEGKKGRQREGKGGWEKKELGQKTV